MSLRAQKQQRAREQIVDAAFQLFAERGFAQVTVTDIAERAQVGRTTFFRYFGDKQEVVFADEQELVEAFATVPVGGAAPSSLRAALRQLRALAERLGPLIVGDPARYAAHEQLIAGNPELRDRAERKLQRIAEAMEGVLVARGAQAEIAVLAAQLAMACFRAAQRVAGPDPDALLPAVRRLTDLLMTDD
jgi:AcrR family transcriptional regulator